MKGRATAFVILVVAWLVIACNDVPTVPPGQLASPLLGAYSYTPASSHHANGTLVFADVQFPDSVNPLFAGSTVDFEVRSALWAAPVGYDEHFHVYPDQLTEVPLPENGDVQDNGKTIIMHLRHDLRWSDGQPLLASDFRYWWQINQDPATGAIATAGYDQIASIETPDQFTVILHMKRTFGPYLFYLPYAAPQHAWQHVQDIDLQNTPGIYAAPDITDGPYKLATYVAGQSISMVPNPYYTSTTFHGPFVAHLIYRAYGSISALSAAAQRQQVDVTQGYMEYDLPALAHLPSAVRLVEGQTAAYAHLDFNNARPLFQDVRVRRAVQMAIDKCALLKVALHQSDCSRSVSQVEPLPSLVYDTAIQPGVYNPAQAKALLAQAGWQLDGHGRLTRNGQPFNIRLVTTSNNPLRAAVARMIQHYLGVLGIQVTIATYPLGQFFAVYGRGGILATGAYDLALFTYANGPEPDDEYATYHSSQIPSTTQPDLGNYARVNDPIIDKALTSARYTVSFLAKVQYYHQFLERMADQAYVIPLYTDVNILTVNTHVRGIIPNPNAAENTWNISDWWLSS